MKVVAAAGALMAVCGAQSVDYRAMWKKFKADYGKSYESNDNQEQQRYNIFKSNVDIITSHNAGNASFSLGVNEFADQTAAEFFQTHLGYSGEAANGDLPREPFPLIADAPDSIDWVAKGAVTPVKNQAHCGSCWAFSSTGAMEGAFFVSSGKLVSLSEEELVQCDHSGDSGCQGGIMENAFGWVKKNGICSEQAYPYTSGGGVRGTCHACNAVVTVGGFVDVPPNDEDALKKAVSTQPVSVAIEADKPAFQLYNGGVLDKAGCGKQLDHGVLIVGYGTDAGKPYWKVKNSWGPNWGEQGYIRILRGKNQCGIAMQPSYPTGARVAPPSPPAPPAPPAPAPAGGHYEDPKDGCGADETPVQLQGIDGAFCSPACSGGSCPADVPAGVTAQPQCALQEAGTGKKFCALVCSPSGNDDQCGKDASCKEAGGAGICTYDDDSKARTRLVFSTPTELVV